jgi:CRP/FNR family transcriptional regulator
MSIASPTSTRALPAARAELADYLAGHRLFGVLPREALLHIAEHARQRRYGRDDHLYYEGDVTTDVYVVRSGLLAMSEMDDRGVSCFVITYAADDVSGSMCATLGNVHPCRTTALVDSEVMLLSKRIFDSLYEQYPALGRRVLEEVNHIMRRSRRTIMRHMLTPVSARLASFLLSVPEVAPGAAPRVELTLSHQDIALLLGTSRETVTRVLDRFSNEGAVAVARRSIEILDRKRLARLVSE